MPNADRVLIDSSLELYRVRGHLADTPLEVQPLPSVLEDAEDVLAVVSWQMPIGEPELRRMPHLRLVLTPSVGYDHLDLAAAGRHGGVFVCHVPDYCVAEMADTTIALVLALVRGVVALDRDVSAGGWDAHAAGPLRRVRGARLGLVGFGRIGAAVAERAQALGMGTWAVDPQVTAAELARRGVRSASLDDLLAGCHVVSLHAPLTERTAGLIGRRELARMPVGAFLVNTARGGLVDTQALLEALDGGRLGGAALDVLPVEPPTREAPAPRARNLIVTPHAAYQSAEAEEELHRRVAEAIKAVARGGAPRGALVAPQRRG